MNFFCRCKKLRFVYFFNFDRTIDFCFYSVLLHKDQHFLIFSYTRSYSIIGSYNGINNSQFTKRTRFCTCNFQNNISVTRIVSPSTNTTRINSILSILFCFIHKRTFLLLPEVLCWATVCRTPRLLTLALNTNQSINQCYIEIDKTREILKTGCEVNCLNTVLKNDQQSGTFLRDYCNSNLKGISKVWHDLLFFFFKKFVFNIQGCNRKRAITHIMSRYTHNTNIFLPLYSIWNLVHRRR